MTTPCIVLDTNIVLDLYVFLDPASAPLILALQRKSLHWIATAAMRDELARVLCYPQISQRQARHPDLQCENCSDLVSMILRRFDAMASLVPTAIKAPVTCRDPDDQKFIDLAVAHRCLLLSKDKAVLCMKKRLLALGVYTFAAMKLDIPG